MLRRADLHIRDGRIAEHTNDADILDATGLILCPGLIDIHVHLREPGQAYKETIASGTRAAAAGGFTALCCMPNTQPINDSPEITHWMQSPRRGAVVNVFPIAAATVASLGAELTDYSAMHAAGAVAVTDDGKPVLDDDVMRSALTAAKREGIPVIQHAEDTRQTQHAPMNAGPVALRLGLRGWAADAETSIVERDIALAAETGAHLHVAHLSTAGAMAAVRKAKAAGVHVTCEVTPHHFLLTDESIATFRYDTNFKMNPPLRSEHDREALIAGIFDGTVDAIATDHAPHAAHEKQQEFDRAPFGITGLETALGLSLEELHRKRGLPLDRLIALLSTRPAELMGLKDRGTLRPGAHADITLFDPHERWTYHARDSRSMSKNSPFDGYEMQGRVRYTIVAGKIVFQA
ncbi:MAG: dihydroorotase [Acidobacteriaceae bacterium]